MGHIGINRLLYEIERRGLFCNKISKKIEEIIKKCSICIINKLNTYIKPMNTQIISHKPLERVQIDLTYFNKKLELEEIRDNYLLNFTDHFSKFCKGFLIQNKTSEQIINCFKIFIKEVGTPKIIH